jgi:hypothetical protein
VESAEAHGMFYPAYQEKKGNLKNRKRYIFVLIKLFGLLFERFLVHLPLIHQLFCQYLSNISSRLFRVQYKTG